VTDGYNLPQAVVFFCYLTLKSTAKRNRMATRLDVQARRKALYDSLKQACLDGSFSPGVMLPTVRELGERHGISTNVAFGVIQSMIDEGLLYTVPRVGTFVGRLQQEKVEPYLMLLPARITNPENSWLQAQAGFEDRIAQLGGHSIVLTGEEAELHLQQNSLPPLSGVFATNHPQISHLFADTNVQRVLYGSLEVDGGEVDRVTFDDISGGALATRHLWQNGHRSIAFLAMHSADDQGVFSWSRNREIGWRRTLEQVGINSENLAFHPKRYLGFQPANQLANAREAAKDLIGRNDISAVIAVNVMAASGMLEAFQTSGWPIQHWPAVVCFDQAPRSSNPVVSYLRLPWEEIGREAAQILWERRNGRLKGEATQRLVSMRLIPRLSCRADWVTSSGLAQSRAVESSL
jgi:DNA-binding LacI/PurR family transcriptional regulator